MEEKAGSQVLFVSYPLTELRIDSLKEKGGVCVCKPEENITCCSGLQLTCVFLDISAAPMANDWGRASTAQQKADSVPQMQVLTSPLVRCNSVLNSLEQKRKFPRYLSRNGPLNSSLPRSPSGAGWAWSPQQSPCSRWLHGAVACSQGTGAA